MSKPTYGGDTTPAAHAVSRRTALAALTAAGVALVAEGVLGYAARASADGECCETVTIADLRANTTPQANHLYYVHEQGKEGIFLYDTGDTTSIDNAGTIVVSTSGARFKRVYDDWIDARWFGAIGDGTTHPVGTLPNADYPIAASATDEKDWAAIQAAIEWAKTAKTRTGKVWIPSGTYFINRPIRPEGDDIELRGTAGTILSLQANDAAIEIGPSGPYDNVIIRELAIHAASGYGPADKGIVQIDNVVDILVDHVRIVANAAVLTSAGRNCNGIAFGNGTSGAIRHSSVEATTKAGILIASGASNVRLDGCVVQEVSGPAGDQPGILLRGCNNVTVFGCLSKDNEGAGLQVETASGVNTSTILVEAGCYRNNGGSGIWITSSVDGTNPSEVQINEAVTENNAKDGLCAEAGVRMTIAQPIARYNGECGIRFSQKYTASANDNLQLVKVACPVSYNNGQMTASSSAGIEIKATHRLAIRGGAVYDNQGTATQDCGIRIATDANGKVPRHLFLQDVDVYGHAANYDLNAAKAASGHYRIVHELPSPGTPEGVIAAPIGSEYVDCTSGAGRKFIKKTGTAATGWKAMTFVP